MTRRGVPRLAARRGHVADGRSHIPTMPGPAPRTGRSFPYKAVIALGGFARSGVPVPRWRGTGAGRAWPRAAGSRWRPGPRAPGGAAGRCSAWRSSSSAVARHQRGPLPTGAVEGGHPQHPRAVDGAGGVAVAAGRIAEGACGDIRWHGGRLCHARLRQSAPRAGWVAPDWLEMYRALVPWPIELLVVPLAGIRPRRAGSWARRSRGRLG